MFSGLRCWSPQAYALLVSGRTSGRTVSQPSPTLFVLAPGHLRPHKASYTSRRRLSSHQKGCTCTAAVAASGELTLRAGLPAPPFHSRVAGLFSPDGSPNPFRTYGSSFYSSLSRGPFFISYFAVCFLFRTHYDWSSRLASLFCTCCVCRTCPCSRFRQWCVPRILHHPASLSHATVQVLLPMARNSVHRSLAPVPTATRPSVLSTRSSRSETRMMVL